MTIFAIGDVQGCFDPLQALLEKIKFDPVGDTLWFTGDLVNRGPRSLDVLRFIKGLGDKHITVLGNHDLHLLALAYGATNYKSKDTLTAILNAPDRDELIHWLRNRPLFYKDPLYGYCLVHAGIAPSWDLPQAQQLAHEVEAVLQSDTPGYLFTNMYGNQPDLWRDNLQGIERWRCIINYFTRMRYCHADGRLELLFKGAIKDKPSDLIPWFNLPERKNKAAKIIFGHWAALGGETHQANLHALDTGCVWGNSLTAMTVPEGRRIMVACAVPR